MRFTALFLLCASCALAEVHTLTLQQALDRALAQSPDVVLARLDEQRAKLQIGITNDGFTLKCGAGSGIAYTFGFPASIGGNPPAILQSQCKRAVFDLPQNYRVAQTKEYVKGATITARQRQEEVAYRVTAAFLDVEHAALSAKAAKDELSSLERIRPLVEGRVREGRELDIELQQADVNIENARVSVAQFEHTQASAEIPLAQILGLPPGDRVKAALEERVQSNLPQSQEAALAEAMDRSLTIRKLESDIVAKQWEVKSNLAERWPKINAFSQYSLLSKFNNLEEFYPRFQRHNLQAGVSIEIPILTGSAPKAAAAQADVDLEKLRREIAREKSRIAEDIQQSYSDLDLATVTQKARRAALDLARKRVDQQLTLTQEGRGTTAQLETIRADEQQAWMAYYDAQRSLEVARLNLRKATGTILAAAQ